MTDKRATQAQLAPYFRSGIRVMIGGFLGCGTPYTLIRALLASGASDLTLIACDTSFPGMGNGTLVDAKRFARIIVSHIGTNPETQRQMAAGELDVEFAPQGTLAERIRAGGSGLGGVITPTGVGTLAAKGKQTITLQGKEYLIELPLRAHLALIRATRADEAGNAFYEGSTRNFNALMAMAADTVLLEADEIVPVGAIAPEAVMSPGLCVTRMILGEGERARG